MKTFVVACIAALVIAVIGGLALNSVGDSSEKAYTTTGARIGS